MTSARPATSPARPRLDSLTGIRALAAGLVCWTHAAFWAGLYPDPTWGMAWGRLEIGVALFFVLSGFLLFRPWVAAAHGDPTPSLRRYAWHRVRRILPAYWITVLAAFLLLPRPVELVAGQVPPPDPAVGSGEFWRSMTLTQIYGAGHFHDGLTQTWSLAVEVAFYLLLPFVGVAAHRLLCRRRFRPVLLLIACAGLAAVTPLWSLITHGSAQSIFQSLGLSEWDVTPRLWLPGFLAWFAGGMALAVLTVWGRQWKDPIFSLASLVLAIAAASLVTTQGAGGEPTIIPEDGGTAVTKALLYLVVGVALIAPLVLGRDAVAGAWRGLLSHPVLVWLGEISYEFFLVHVIIMEFVVGWLGYETFQGSVLGIGIVTTVLSIPVAWALHRALLPLQRL